MNSAVYRTHVPSSSYSYDSHLKVQFKRLDEARLRFKSSRHFPAPKMKVINIPNELSAKWINSPEVLAKQAPKLIARERRRRELEESEKKIMLQRKTRQFEHLLAKSYHFGSNRSSTPGKSFDSWSIETVINTSSNLERGSEDSGEALSCYSSEYVYAAPISLSSSLPRSRKKVRQLSTLTYLSSQDHARLSMDRVDEDSPSQQIKQTKQYLALMKVVSNESTTKKEPKVPIRMKTKNGVAISKEWLETDHIVDESFKKLKNDLDKNIPWPEEWFFQVNFHIQPNNWFTVEIKELLTIPERLAIRFDDCEHTDTVATVMIAAWDNYFYKNRKAAMKPIKCELFQNERGIDNFFHASKPVKELAILKCLWKPLTNTVILKEYCDWLLCNPQRQIPEYLMESGYMKEVINAKAKKRNISNGNPSNLRPNKAAGVLEREFTKLELSEKTSSKVTRNGKCRTLFA